MAKQLPAANGHGELTVEWVAIDSILPDPANVRKHSEKNMRAVEGSLRRFGIQAPIIVDKVGVVVAGHARLEALRKLGYDKIPVVRSTLEGAERIAFAIADNRTAELAEWDDEALYDALGGLDGIDQFGFDDADLGAFDVEPIDNDGVEIGKANVGHRQLSVILTDDQFERVGIAIKRANEQGAYVGTGNENVNGNAVARIADFYATRHR